MSEIVKIGKKSQLTIPKKIREKLNISEGDKIFIDVIDGAIVITPIPENIEKFAGISKGFYEKEYLNKERNSWDN